MKDLNLTILFTLLMSMVGTKAFAHDIEVENADGVILYYNYINEGKELEVTLNNDMFNSYKGDVVIPENVEFMNRTRKVTSIGKNAFRNCKSLSSVNIPKSITSIYESAFVDCILKSITIPSSVTYIAYNAFMNCSLSEINVEEGNPIYDSRDNCNAIIITADNELFKGCGNTIIPNSITSIKSNSFMNCNSLTSVNIPNSVCSIGSSAFYGCKNLTSVNIPGSVSSISSYTFYGCSNLSSVTILSGVTSIGDGAFMECTKLTDLIIPNSVTTIGESTFWGCGLKSLTIPNSVTSINKNTFFGCSKLESVTIPNSVISIGESAFSNCTSLKFLTIENGVSSIGEYAFSECSKLNSVTIGNSITTIGYGAFRSCNALTSVNISDLAAWCNINFGDFNYSSWTGVYSNPNSNPLFFANHLYLNGEEIKKLVIPNGVTFIGSGAFIGCGSLTSVTIPSSVTSIGSQAFNYASIPTIISQIEDPFSFHGKIFSDNTIKNATLFVPVGTIEKYKSTEGWKEFLFIEEGTGNMIVNGDANGDGTVNAADIVEVVNYIIGSPSDKFIEDTADANGDGIVNAADIVQIVNIIMKSN